MTDPTQPAPSPASVPSLHVDSDWKAQAQAERERLAKQESERAGKPGAGDPDALPPAEFRSLVGLLASQAVMGLGTMGDQQGRLIIDLAGSKFAIELLDVLKAKTKGNLSPEEVRELDEVLHELKSRFMQITQMVAEQMARGQATVAPAGVSPASPASTASATSAAPAAKPGGASKLIVP